GADLVSVGARFDIQTALQTTRLIQGQHKRWFEIDDFAAWKLHQVFEGCIRRQRFGNDLIVVAGVHEVEAEHHIERLGVKPAQIEVKRRGFKHSFSSRVQVLKAGWIDEARSEAA